MTIVRLNFNALQQYKARFMVLRTFVELKKLFCLNIFGLFVKYELKKIRRISSSNKTEIRLLKIDNMGIDLVYFP